MSQRLLKRWESPRREGRNHKGKRGAARKRQLKKQQQMLRNKLKDDSGSKSKKSSKNQGKERDIKLFPFFCPFLAKKLGSLLNPLFFKSIHNLA